MTISVQLVEYLLFDNLRYFNTSGERIDRDSILGDCLSDKDIFSGTGARSLFQAVSRHDIVINHGTDRKWPEDWLTRSCKTLAPKLASGAGQ